MTTYKTEFPGFVLSDQDTPIPADWVDISWGNDGCPCWNAGLCNGSEIRVWVDYQNPADRQQDVEHRFSVQVEDTLTYHDTDDWAEALLTVAKLQMGDAATVPIRDSRDEYHARMIHKAPVLLSTLKELLELHIAQHNCTVHAAARALITDIEGN